MSSRIRSTNVCDTSSDGDTHVPNMFKPMLKQKSYGPDMNLAQTDRQTFIGDIIINHPSTRNCTLGLGPLSLSHSTVHNLT